MLRTFLIIALLVALAFAGNHGGGEGSCYEEAKECEAECNCACAGECQDTDHCICGCEDDSGCAEGYHCDQDAGGVCRENEVEEPFGRGPGVDGVTPIGGGTEYPGGLDQNLVHLQWGSYIGVQTFMDTMGLLGAGNPTNTYLQSFNGKQWNGGRVSKGLTEAFNAYAGSFINGYEGNNYWAGRGTDTYGKGGFGTRLSGYEVPVAPQFDADLQGRIEVVKIGGTLSGFGKRDEATEKCSRDCGCLSQLKVSPDVCASTAYNKCDGTKPSTDPRAIASYLVHRGCVFFQLKEYSTVKQGPIREPWFTRNPDLLQVAAPKLGTPLTSKEVLKLKSIPTFNSYGVVFSDKKGKVALPVLKKGEKTPSWALCPLRKTKKYADNSFVCA